MINRTDYTLNIIRILSIIFRVLNYYYPQAFASDGYILTTPKYCKKSKVSVYSTPVTLIPLPSLTDHGTQHWCDCTAMQAGLQTLWAVN